MSHLVCLSGVLATDTCDCMKTTRIYIRYNARYTQQSIANNRHAVGILHTRIRHMAHIIYVYLRICDLLLLLVCRTKTRMQARGHTPDSDAIVSFRIWLVCIWGAF